MCAMQNGPAVSTVAVPMAARAPRDSDVMLLDASGGRAARVQAAGQDLRDGTALWRLAAILAWLDIRLRYRGSALGPIWLTLSSAVMVASMGFIYGTLFQTVLHDYLPFLAVSIIVWQAGLQALVSEACTVFLDAEPTIRSMRMPFTLQVMRSVIRNLIVLGHNLVVPLAVFAIFDVWPGWKAVLALPGLMLWVADGVACGFLLGSICARFRDVPPIVGSIMQIAFYITPIVWKPAQLGRHGWWLPINPFYDLLELVRGPVLGAVPIPLIWAAAAGYSLLLWAAAWFVFIRARPRLAFWV